MATGGDCRQKKLKHESENNVKNKLISDKNFYREVAALATPIILQNLITSTLAMADTFMVGLLGEAPMAAVTLANIPLFVVQLFIFGAVSGSSVLMGQYWGKKDMDAISRVVGLGCYTAGSVSLLVAMILLLFPTQFLSLFGNDPNLIALAAEYGQLAGFSWVLNSFTMVVIAAWRSVERPEMGLYILVPSMCCNTFLNWVFIFGNLGMPQMGVRGAAMATLVSRVIELGIVLYFTRKKDLFCPKFNLMLHPGWDMAKRYFYCSAPVVLNESLWGLGTSVLPMVMGHMAGSTEILAAYAIVYNVEKLCSVAAFGLASTAAVIIGREVGAGRGDDVHRIGVTLNAMSVAFGIVIGVLLIVFAFTAAPLWVYPLFGLSDTAREIATMMLLVQGFGMWLKDFNTCNIVGVLRGGGDIQMATIIDLIPLWLMSVPFSVVTGLVLGLSINWVYLAFLIEQGGKVVAGIWRLRTGKWVRDLTKS